MPEIMQLFYAIYNAFKEKESILNEYIKLFDRSKTLTFQQEKDLWQLITQIEQYYNILTEKILKYRAENQDSIEYSAAFQTVEAFQNKLLQIKKTLITGYDIKANTKYDLGHLLSCKLYEFSLILKNRPNGSFYESEQLYIQSIDKFLKHIIDSEKNNLKNEEMDLLWEAQYLISTFGIKNNENEQEIYQTNLEKQILEIADTFLVIQNKKDFIDEYYQEAVTNIGHIKPLNNFKENYAEDDNEFSILKKVINDDIKLLEKQIVNWDEYIKYYKNDNNKKIIGLVYLSALQHQINKVENDILCLNSEILDSFSQLNIRISTIIWDFNPSKIELQNLIPIIAHILMPKNTGYSSKEADLLTLQYLFSTQSMSTIKPSLTENVDNDIQNVEKIFKDYYQRIFEIFQKLENNNFVYNDALKNELLAFNDSFNKWQEDNVKFIERYHIERASQYFESPENSYKPSRLEELYSKKRDALFLKIQKDAFGEPFDNENNYIIYLQLKALLYAAEKTLTGDNTDNKRFQESILLVTLKLYFKEERSPSNKKGMLMSKRFEVEKDYLKVVSMYLQHIMQFSVIDLQTTEEDQKQLVIIMYDACREAFAKLEYKFKNNKDNKNLEGKEREDFYIYNTLKFFKKMILPYLYKNKINKGVTLEFPKLETEQTKLINKIIIILGSSSKNQDYVHDLKVLNKNITGLLKLEGYGNDGQSEAESLLSLYKNYKNNHDVLELREYLKKFDTVSQNTSNENENLYEGIDKLVADIRESANHAIESVHPEKENRNLPSIPILCAFQYLINMELAKAGDIDVIANMNAVNTVFGINLEDTKVRLVREDDLLKDLKDKINLFDKEFTKLCQELAINPEGEYITCYENYLILNKIEILYRGIIPNNFEMYSPIIDMQEFKEPSTQLDALNDRIKTVMNRLTEKFTEKFPRDSLDVLEDELMVISLSLYHCLKLALNEQLMGIDWAVFHKMAADSQDIQLKILEQSSIAKNEPMLCEFLEEKQQKKFKNINANDVYDQMFLWAFEMTKFAKETGDILSDYQLGDADRPFTVYEKIDDEELRNDLNDRKKHVQKCQIDYENTLEKNSPHQATGLSLIVKMNRQSNVVFDFTPVKARNSFNNICQELQKDDGKYKANIYNYERFIALSILGLKVLTSKNDNRSHFYIEIFKKITTIQSEINFVNVHTKEAFYFVSSRLIALLNDYKNNYDDIDLDLFSVLKLEFQNIYSAFLLSDPKFVKSSENALLLAINSLLVNLEKIEDTKQKEALIKHQLEKLAPLYWKIFDNNPDKLLTYEVSDKEEEIGFSENNTTSDGGLDDISGDNTEPKNTKQNFTIPDKDKKDATNGTNLEVEHPYEASQKPIIMPTENPYINDDNEAISPIIPNEKRNGDGEENTDHEELIGNIIDDKHSDNIEIIPDDEVEKKPVINIPATNVNYNSSPKVGLSNFHEAYSQNAIAVKFEALKNKIVQSQNIQLKSESEVKFIPFEKWANDTNEVNAYSAENKSQNIVIKAQNGSDSKGNISVAMNQELTNKSRALQQSSSQFAIDSTNLDAHKLTAEQSQMLSQYFENNRPKLWNHNNDYSSFGRDKTNSFMFDVIKQSTKPLSETEKLNIEALIKTAKYADSPDMLPSHQTVQTHDGAASKGSGRSGIVNAYMNTPLSKMEIKLYGTGHVILLTQAAFHIQTCVQAIIKNAKGEKTDMSNEEAINSLVTIAVSAQIFNYIHQFSARLSGQLGLGLLLGQALVMMTYYKENAAYQKLIEANVAYLEAHPELNPQSSLDKNILKIQKIAALIDAEAQFQLNPNIKTSMNLIEIANIFSIPVVPMLQHYLRLQDGSLVELMPTLYTQNRLHYVSSQNQDVLSIPIIKDALYDNVDGVRPECIVVRDKNGVEEDRFTMRYTGSDGLLYENYPDQLDIWASAQNKWHHSETDYYDIVSMADESKRKVYEKLFHYELILDKQKNAVYLEDRITSQIVAYLGWDKSEQIWTIPAYKNEETYFALTLDQFADLSKKAEMKFKPQQQAIIFDSPEYLKKQLFESLQYENRIEITEKLKSMSDHLYQQGLLEKETQYFIHTITPNQSTLIYSTINMFVENYGTEQISEPFQNQLLDLKKIQKQYEDFASQHIKQATLPYQSLGIQSAMDRVFH